MPYGPRSSPSHSTRQPECPWRVGCDKLSGRVVHRALRKVAPALVPSWAASDACVRGILFSGGTDGRFARAGPQSRQADVAHSSGPGPRRRAFPTAGPRRSRCEWSSSHTVGALSEPYFRLMHQNAAFSVQTFMKARTAGGHEACERAGLRFCRSRLWTRSLVGIRWTGQVKNAYNERGARRDHRAACSFGTHRRSSRPEKSTARERNAARAAIRWTLHARDPRLATTQARHREIPVGASE